MGMGAWSETAVFRNLQHFREIQGYLLLLQVHQTEASQTGSVDNEPERFFTEFRMTGGESIHLIEGSGMLSLQMHIGNLSHTRIQRRIQCLDQRRLAHSGDT